MRGCLPLCTNATDITSNKRCSLFDRQQPRKIKVILWPKSTPKSLTIAWRENSLLMNVGRSIILRLKRIFEAKIEYLHYNTSIVSTRCQFSFLFAYFVSYFVAFSIPFSLVFPNPSFAIRQRHNNIVWIPILTFRLIWFTIFFLIIVYASSIFNRIAECQSVTIQTLY